jgi:tRNA pseudouridine13 synthase
VSNTVLFDLDFPRAFSQLNAIGGFRLQPEDFFVDESLGFELSGTGEHVCLHVEKREQNTVWVAKQLAEIKGCSPETIGEQTSCNFDALFAGVLA